MTQRRRRFGSNAFELGIFSFNVQNGMSKLKEVLWPSTWQQNLELARAAEEAGLEFLAPARSAGAERAATPPRPTTRAAPSRR